MEKVDISLEDLNKIVKKALSSRELGDKLKDDNIPFGYLNTRHFHTYYIHIQHGIAVIESKEYDDDFIIKPIKMVDNRELEYLDSMEREKELELEMIRYIKETQKLRRIFKDIKKDA